MSRAVIDQAGFRVVFIGFLISLVLGLSLRAQIAPARIKNLLQESVSRLEKDFIIDFNSAEVVLSNWGLPLPYLQISNIRISPKKAICQDSQIYIENLNLPLSITSLVTSESLITEINASRVELRIADLNHCFDQPAKSNAKVASASNDNHFLKTDVVANEIKKASLSSANAQKSEKNIFESKTAALLKKINIDQLKVISKKYASQPIEFRHMSVDLSYLGEFLNKLDINSQVYALKDAQSDIMYFKGDLVVQVYSNKTEQIDTVLKLNGRMLDGEVHLFALVNSIEKNIKVDVNAKKVALKPFVQLNLIDSSMLNFPLTFDFNGYGFYQYDINQLTDLKVKDIEISGDHTHVLIDEVAAKTEKNKLVILPFKANIESLNLNKIINPNQNKNITQSIENFGDFKGALNFKSNEKADLQGTWKGLEFIFANRGRRELQKIDSFDVQATLDSNSILTNLKNFKLNQTDILGEAQIQYWLDTYAVQGKADLVGPLLNDNVWMLLTQKEQHPNVSIQWNYKKNKEERHQLSMDLDQVYTLGMDFKDLNVSFIQTLQDGVSSSVVVQAKSDKLNILTDQLKLNVLTQLFNANTVLNDTKYVAEQFHANLKGVDWRSMNFELDTHLRASENAKTSSLKIKGDWSENDFVSGLISVQSNGQVSRFQLNKSVNQDLGITEL